VTIERRLLDWEQQTRLGDHAPDELAAGGRSTHPTSSHSSAPERASKQASSSNEPDRQPVDTAA